MKRPLHLIPIESSSRTEKPILSIHKLNKIFQNDGGHLSVLQDISFKISAGELVCISGPSGCGKTTLLKLIAGLMKPSSGNIWIGSHEVTRPGPDRCVVFQEDALFPWLTVAENIAFGAKRIIDRRVLKKEVNTYLEMVGLSAFKNYLPREISGGMKQRVALARVLILKPRILLMDEPFGALDAQTREEMQNLLLSLWKEFSHTILFVTHDLSEAATLADRIIIMSRNAGQIKSDIPVPLHRPRKKESNDFHQFYRELRSCL